MASGQRSMECPVCMDPFTSSDRIPKGLRCLHSICLLCAKQLIKNKEIQCPTCRHVEPITDANQLFNHHMMLEMVQECDQQGTQRGQKAIKDDLEEACDRITQYKLALCKKLAIADENSMKLKKSIVQTKREIKTKFDLCIQMLQDRMNQLLGEVETTEKSFKGKAKDAQSSFDKAAHLQHEYDTLVEKELVTEVEYDTFKRNEVVIKALFEKDDQPCQEICQVSFDQSPNIEDVIKKFGQLEGPKPAAGVPHTFSQLVPQRTTGTKGSELGQFNCPCGVAVRPTGTLLVADRGNHRVQELDKRGHVTRVIGAEGSINGFFKFPTGVAIDFSGKVYVTDQHNNRIQIFDHEGKYLKKFGQGGFGCVEVKYPTGLALDDALNLLYVTDLNNHRIQVFDLEGNYKRQIGNGTELISPYYVCLHGNRLYVSDIGSHSIVVYRTDGILLYVTGKKGNNPGEFDWPAGIAADPYGRIWVCDRYNNRIQVLDGETGNVVHVFGSKGSGPGQYNGPFGVALTQSGQLVVSEFEGGRLQIVDIK